jgi:hypothetical protein
VGSSICEVMLWVVEIQEQEQSLSLGDNDKLYFPSIRSFRPAVSLPCCPDGDDKRLMRSSERLTRVVAVMSNASTVLISKYNGTAHSTYLPFSHLNHTGPSPATNQPCLLRCERRRLTTKISVDGLIPFPPPSTYPAGMMVIRNSRSCP